MQRERVTRRSQAAMVVGWVSNTDAILVGLVITLAVTMIIAVRLQRSEQNSRQKQRNVDSFQSQLSELQGRVADLKADRDHLIQLGRQRIKELSTSNASLETNYAQLKAAAQGEAAERAQLATDNEKLVARLAACRDYYLKMKKDLERATAQGQEATIKLVAATEEIDVVQKNSRLLRSQMEAEAGVHRELIGLKGRMHRVAIVFDTSGSMGTDGRWDHARGVVATWLEHLAIRECVLVLFSTDAKVFPEDGTLLNLSGPDGLPNRRRLLDRIRYTQPEGGTNTLLALQTAYRYLQLDTIILFTDGEPNDGNSDQFDPAIAEKIYALSRQHKDIPVNTVGLGDYFKPQLAGFLRRVAQESGGSFLGR